KKIGQTQHILRRPICYNADAGASVTVAPAFPGLRTVAPVRGLLVMEVQSCAQKWCRHAPFLSWAAMVTEARLMWNPSSKPGQPRRLERLGLVRVPRDAARKTRVHLEHRPA